MSASSAGHAPRSRPDWDTYFLRQAFLVATRSPDVHTQHGCIIVDNQKRVVSQGYNGPVQGLSHDVVDFERPGKYYYMIHAEMNALLFAQCNLSGATAYVTGHPCAGCMRSLLQAGIKRIVHGGRKTNSMHPEEIAACRKMSGGVDVPVVEKIIESPY